jgi:sialic acid synthase SpsE
MKIISEIGINHNGDFRRLEEMIRQSAHGGADYAKFQLYSSKRVFGDDSRKHNELSFSETKEISEACKYYGIEFFASVFDEERLAWCEELNVKRYKIASRTVIKEPELCEKIVSLKKPTFISLGFWDKYSQHGDVKEFPFDPVSHSNVQYFHCVSKYPTSFKNYQRFMYSSHACGFSDHSYGISYALYNISRGARIIEKHFTLSKGMDGNDHIGSMSLEDLCELKRIGSELENIYKRLA